MVENNTNTALGCLGTFPHNKLSISNFFTVFDFVILIILELELDCKNFSKDRIILFTLDDRKKLF